MYGDSSPDIITAREAEELRKNGKSEVDYETHPAAELFPMMEEPELEALARDIEANGLRQRIVLFEGQVLDGVPKCTWIRFEDRVSIFIWPDGTTSFGVKGLSAEADRRGISIRASAKLLQGPFFDNVPVPNTPANFARALAATITQDGANPLIGSTPPRTRRAVDKPAAVTAPRYET
ncbi:MAG: hypothetical protein GTN83_21420 [Acidobacteria bacterium]|nr:hypothetical protein [Acidobacteriota bacterium]